MGVNWNPCYYCYTFKTYIYSANKSGRANFLNVYAVLFLLKYRGLSWLKIFKMSNKLTFALSDLASKIFMFNIKLVSRICCQINNTSNACLFLEIGAKTPSHDLSKKSPLWTTYELYKRFLIHNIEMTLKCNIMNAYKFSTKLEL